ncbi:DUF488 domain-containing protein [Desertibaculum subflavum]|uniref:DUF488 domain-containing protein n=1 Tax=Desertibaculum subflavum TaxID=2268458 RepID=UPI0013C4E79B
MTTIHSIGHSNHPIERFIGLLQAAGIRRLADIRSVPASRFCPQFNGKALAASLGAAGIDYVWLGDRLGGKPKDPALLRAGKPDYPKIAASASFRDGLDTIVDLATEAPLAMMCAERAPLDCHRTHLVAPALAERGVEVIHLLADGTAQPHRELKLI